MSDITAKLVVELRSDLLGTPSIGIEKTAYTLPSGTDSEDIYGVLCKVAKQNPLHILSWEIKIGNKSESGTYRSDNATDSESTLKEDVERAMEKLCTF